MPSRPKRGRRYNSPMPRSATPSSTSTIASRGTPRSSAYSVFGGNARNGEPSRASRLLREARWLAFAALAIYLFLILVTYTAADPEYTQTMMGVSLQGTLVDTVSVTAGQVFKRTYRVTVSDAVPVFPPAV